MLSLAIAVAAGAFLVAFSNGANDNFKGFATVWGSRTLTYRRALLLATLATAAGSFASLLLAHGLVLRFSGKGLVPDSALADPAFISAVAIGAGLTVLAATRTGMPVSTTHALLGGLLGAGLEFSGRGINLAVLGQSFVLPLLVSPVVAALAGVAVYQFFRRRREEADCICVPEPMFMLAAAGALRMESMYDPAPVVVGSASDCDRLGDVRWRISVPAALDRVHILSAMSICFARSVNDTPKIAALLITARVLGAQLSVALVAVLMTAGGLLLARRVAETMSLRLNRMDAAQGISANLITAFLVLFASHLGMPVSTTHVSVGSIAGVGAGAGTLDKAALRAVLLSWVATLPAAALFAALAVALLHGTGL